MAWAPPTSPSRRAQTRTSLDQRVLFPPRADIFDDIGEAEMIKAAGINDKNIAYELCASLVKRKIASELEDADDELVIHW